MKWYLASITEFFGRMYKGRAIDVRKIGIVCADNFIRYSFVIVFKWKFYRLQEDILTTEYYLAFYCHH